MFFNKLRVPKDVVIMLSVFTMLCGVLYWSDVWSYNYRLKTAQSHWYLIAPVQYLENIISDMTTALVSGQPADPKISIAAIDDETVAKMGFPFPRRFHAKLIDRLSELGAKAIIFDVMFLEPDKRDPENDKLLLVSVKKAGNVVLAGLVATETVMPQHEKDELVEGTQRFSFQYPMDELCGAAFLCASPNTDGFTDPDGHLRQMKLFDRRLSYDRRPGLGCRDCVGKPVASLSAGAYALFKGMDLDEVYGKFSGTNIFRLNFTQPLMRILHPAHPETRASGEKSRPLYYPYISILDILSDELSLQEKDEIKGGVILVGSTTMGNFDHYPGPFGSPVPGVTYHANFLDNLAHENWMRVVNPWIAFAALLAMIWLSLLLLNTGVVGGALLTAGILAAWVIIYLALFLAGRQLYFVLPVLGLVGGYILISVYRVVVEGREKRWIKSTFGQYLSPKVVEVIVKDPDKLRLGGEKRDMTVFFLDIAHFTTISEKMAASDLTVFLNRYLSAFTDIILKNDGVVDKYIGDCIMAFWNAPLDLPEHRRWACVSAVECITALNELNKALPPGLPETPAIRIGLNAGQMTVGNFGSTTRFSYTVIGDEVNLASRLEGANKFFGSRILASEACYAPAKDYVAARELGRVRVVGKSVPIRVFELLAKKEDVTPELAKRLEVFARAGERFSAGDWSGAASGYGEAFRLAPEDAVAKKQLARAEEFLKSGTPQDWDGAFNLTSK